jgi:hypothetical protein
MRRFLNWLFRSSWTNTSTDKGDPWCEVHQGFHPKVKAGCEFWRKEEEEDVCVVD